MGKVIFVTGRPGVGKTTVFLQAIDSLELRGVAVGGFVSREVRVGNIRVGFEIMDLQSRRKGWLAHVDQPDGPRVGRYRVNVKDLTEIGVGAIRRAVTDEKVGIIAVDEIGPMELTSSDFVRVIDDIVASSKAFLATVHFRDKDRILSTFRLEIRPILIEVTVENRATIYGKIVEAIVGSAKTTSPVLGVKCEGIRGFHARTVGRLTGVFFPVFLSSSRTSLLRFG